MDIDLLKASVILHFSYWFFSQASNSVNELI
ncbi:MAG: hypothetical protein ACJAWI_002363, partial [Marinomonas primoryensis]